MSFMVQSTQIHLQTDRSDVADDKLVFGAFLDVFGVQLKDALFFLFCLPNARTHKHTPR